MELRNVNEYKVCHAKPMDMSSKHEDMSNTIKKAVLAIKERNIMFSCFSIDFNKEALHWKNEVVAIVLKHYVLEDIVVNSLDRMEMITAILRGLNEAGIDFICTTKVLSPGMIKTTIEIRGIVTTCGDD